MAERNGGGRLDRIERILEQFGGRLDQLGGRLDQLGGRLDQLGGRLDRLGEHLDQLGERLDTLGQRQREFQIIQEHDHEEFKQDHKQLMIWQTLTQDRIDRLFEISHANEERVEKLVSAIGRLIESLPAAKEAGEGRPEAR
jgi:ABC-type transporter Mla subunit MlaD